MFGALRVKCFIHYTNYLLRNERMGPESYHKDVKTLVTNFICINSKISFKKFQFKRFQEIILLIHG